MVDTRFVCETRPSIGVIPAFYPIELLELLFVMSGIEGEADMPGSIGNHCRGFRPFSNKAGEAWNCQIPSRGLLGFHFGESPFNRAGVGSCDLGDKAHRG